MPASQSWLPKGRRLLGASAVRHVPLSDEISRHHPKTADSHSIANKHGGRSVGEGSPVCFAVQEAGSWPITSFAPFCVCRLPVEADKRYWAAPASGGVALYLAAKRPLDRARKRSRPIRVTIAPPRTATHATPASKTQTIRTGALVSPACCTVAAASTYIRSSANGSYQNPAYSWQLGSKMDGTRLSYG